MAAQSGIPHAMANMNAPYAPMVWPLGGPPVKKVDIPAQSVLMFFFFIGGMVHMKIFQGNRAKAHKFLPNLFIFIFCMSRVVTSIIRIASVVHSRNVQLAIAAQIFVAAGVLILFVINLIFSMRLVRSTHPSFGWHPLFSIVFKFLFIAIAFTIVAVISTTVQSFYTLDASTRALDRSFQLYGSTFLAIVATLPIPIVGLSCLIPYSPLDQFGTGRLRTKVIGLLISSTLLSLGAWYRCGATWQPPVPRTQPLPGYLGKGPFYILNFVVEIQTVIMYAVLGVDQRWYIPNGAKGPGSYSRSDPVLDVEMQHPRPGSATTKASSIRSVTIEIEDKSVISFEKDMEDQPELLCSPCRRLEKGQLLTVPDATLPRMQSQRGSLISNRLTQLFNRSTSTRATPDQKRNWRVSEEARIVRRLGGPWEKLPSPIESTFSKDDDDKSYYTNDDAGSIMYPPSVLSSEAGATAPSIPDVVNDGTWTARIDWEFRSPRRFLSLKKRSMIGL